LPRRLLPLAVAVVALLAVVAVAARGRPLGTGGAAGGGLPLTFWDYVFTTVLIGVVLLAVVAFGIYFFLLPRQRQELKPFHARTARALVILLAVAAFVVIIGRHVDLNHLLHPNASTTTTQTSTIPQARGGQAGKPARHVEFRWEELVVVLGVLLVLGAIGATRSRLRPTLPRRRVASEALAAALDESLDDLRADPDLRRAIVAAYARMESSLAAAGLPRRPAEAPLEYLERALLSLDASADAVRRLTDLFEWARFSHHEPEPAMRDEAVNALVAVRDELRAREPVAM
jgi:Domain of unknown function (DUF4129)